ncbi:MAG: AbrB/MazE/SpoVT family DNA-binding domain-containing protein [Nitrospirae bacterium]|nr:MAG: AbrB/MazE/SpoVT family DNA-binding domain-containing protein [Nitrospirota bacterium]
MLTTKLSSKGQVIIPKSLRTSHHWEQGQELAVVEMEEGILLKPAALFPETTLRETASCLHYTGKPKTLQDMEEAIKKGALESLHVRR